MTDTCSQRAAAVKDACHRDWQQHAAGDRLHKTRHGHRLEVLAEPAVIRNAAGEPVGVDAWVQLHDAQGREVPIDPHRRIINPPTVTRDGRQDPAAAFWESVWDSIDETPNPGGWRTAGTVTVIYGEPADGRLEGQGNTYAAARNGTGTILNDTTGAFSATGQFFVSTYSCYQQYWAFDTSAITDSDEVTAVQLALYQTGQNLAGGNFVVEARAFDWGDTLTTADYRPGNTLNTYTLLASINTNSMGTLNQYYTLNSQPAFLSVPGLKTGMVRLFTSSSKQRTGTAPTAREFVQFATADASGTTTDPRLTITHHGVGTGGTQLVEDFEDATYVVTITAGGDTGWTRDTTEGHDSGASLRSGVITDEQTTDAIVTVPPGATGMRFWYLVSSEETFDKFQLLIDGVEQYPEGGLSGEIPWTQSDTFDVSAATTVIFRYFKDVSVPAGADAAWIDDLTFTFGGGIVRGNVFDGGTHGETITTGNSGGASGDPFNSVVGSLQYTNVQARAGLAAVNPAAGVDCHLDWRAVAQPGDVFCARLYLWLVAAPTAAQRVFVLLGSAGVVSAVWIFPDREITAYAGFSETAAAGFTTPVPTEQWVRIELRYTIGAAGNGTVEMWLYLAANSSAHDDYAISTTLAWPNGKPEGAEFHLQRDTGYWYLDDVAIADEKIGSASPEQSATVGQVAEGDAARSVSGRKTRGIGQAATTAAAHPIAATKRGQVGQAAEDAAAQLLGRRKQRALGGQASELDGVSPMGRAHAAQVSQVAETGTARHIAPLVGTPVPQTGEDDTALPVTGRKIRALGQAAEGDAAAAVAAGLQRAVGQVLAVDSAQPMVRVSVLEVGQAAELDTALRINSSALGLVAEADVALPITPVVYAARPMRAGPVRVAWAAASPRVRWVAGRPRLRWSSVAH
ncbi:hypothetical protein [Nonomuraea aridisoli]|uniref:Uncharacterized protein n=1 Tax=Nonomuraea aridisoli TaxID=2070368 RepID=A0A2W2F4E7_9ACTN|nr:hypothetical protein [Nonomuraea aridisoli]PZG20620.1 hypothetical protein C1J01_08955 [Nonomuraea aridisoli]